MNSAIEQWVTSHPNLLNDWAGSEADIDEILFAVFNGQYSW